MARKKGSKNKPKSIEPVSSPVIEPTFILVLKLNGKEYQGKGDTATDAIKQIKPEYFKTKGVLIARKGEHKLERYMPIFLMRRMFSSETFKKALAASLEMGLR